MNDQQIEQQIVAKGLTAPRVTPQQIEDVIEGEISFTVADAYRFGWLVQGDSVSKETAEAIKSVSASIPVRSYSGLCLDIDANAKTPQELKLLTICILTLKNGFTVIGKSACASPENFDAEIGFKIARQNAVEQIWPLEGYLLKQKLADTPADFRDRVKKEKEELDAKLMALSEFVETAVFFGLPAAEQDRLSDQVDAMAIYSNILADRIKAF